MAEDEPIIEETTEEEDDEAGGFLEAGGEELTSSSPESSSPPKSASPQQKKKTKHTGKVVVEHKKCNLRLEELATPNKRMFLALWNEHSYHFTRDKNDRLKLLLQELYAMTPEETAKYFAELRAEAQAAAHRRKMKAKLRSFLRQKEKRRQRERAYKLFRRLLKCALKYAAHNPVPTLVSLRLRYLSDTILEQLCELKEVKKPDRDGKLDKTDALLIQIADWMAIGMERLYYVAQLAINETTKDGSTSKDCSCDSDSVIRPFKPSDVVSSTPKKPREFL